MAEDMEETRPLLGGKGSVQEDGSSELLQVRQMPQGKTSPLGAIFIIINAALGAGLLAFPVAFYSAGGILPALLVMMVSVGSAISTLLNDAFSSL